MSGQVLFLRGYHSLREFIRCDKVALADRMFLYLVSEVMMMMMLVQNHLGCARVIKKTAN